MSAWPRQWCIATDSDKLCTVD